MNLPRAKRLDAIKPSPTLAVSKLARELKAQGQDILSLAAGEPDFDTPAHIRLAACEAIEAGQTRYTNVDGTPELKQAVIDKFQRDNNLAFQAENIIVSTGGKQVLYNALMASLSPGDEVVIVAPYWVSYPDMVLLADGVPVFVEASAADGFIPSAPAIAAAITDRTRWLILNSPSNPSGAIMGAPQLEALARTLQAYPQVQVMSDEIYEKITYTGAPAPAFATLAARVAPEVAARTLTVNGVSKAYAMTGWRIGFAAGAPELIRAMGVVQSQSTSNPSSISQAAAVAALNGDHAFLDARNETFRARRDLTVAALNQIEGIECRVPDGAFYVYPSCAGVIGRTTPEGKTLHNDTEFAAFLLESAGVAVVPGAAFGLEPHFRISYACADSDLADGCRRIAEAVAKLR